MLRRARLSTRLLRTYSTSSNPYSNFNKLRAFPFAFDEETAKSYMGIAGSALCFKDLIASGLARFFPAARPHGFQPTRIVPLYFPAWIADVELQAKVSLNGDEKTATLQLENAYLPGSDFQVLSTVPLVDSSNLLQRRLEPVPWSTDLTRQFDQDINCVPFTIDPRTGLQALANDTAEIFPKLYCSFNTIQQKFAVFRPVLLPVYLAQYDAEGQAEGEHRSCTVFIDASTESGLVYAMRAPDSTYDEYDTGLDDMLTRVGYDKSGDLITLGRKSHFIDSGSVSLSPPREIVKALLHWLDYKMRDPEIIQKITQSSIISEDIDSDPRIREYTVEDRHSVATWMDIGTEKMMTGRILDRINEQLSEMGDDAPEHMRAPLDHLENNIKLLEQSRESLMPEFWKEYTEQQKEGGKE